MSAPLIAMQRLWLLSLLYLAANSAWCQQALWIDVRSPAEYQQRHRPDAFNIPHDDIAAGIAALQPALDTPIMLYCKSGRRAELAAQTLTALGYTRVVNVGGLEQALQAGP